LRAESAGSGSDPLIETQERREQVSAETSGGGHAAMDYAQHARTYDAFIKGVQISVASLVVLVILMAMFLV